MNPDERKSREGVLPSLPLSALICVHPRFILLCSAIAVFLLYAIASAPNKFVYDDHEVIENQYPADSLSAVVHIFSEPHYLNFPYYRPVTRLTLAIQKAISGNAPRAFHVANALLAAATLLAAYGLLRLPTFGIAPLPALIASLWFCLHPAASECVYPAASGRETSLPTLFILLCLWTWMHRGMGWRSSAIGLLILALLSKELSVVLPVLLLAADLLIVRPTKPGEAPDASLIRRRPMHWWARRYAPVIAAVLGYFLLRHAIFAGSAGFAVVRIEIQNHPLAPLWSILYGVQTAILPPAALVYEPTLAVWRSWPKLLAALVFVIALGILAWRAAPAPRWNAQHRAMLFWLIWFIVLQLPTAQMLRQEAPFSERYVFPALLAVAAVLAMAMSSDLLKPQLAVAAIAAWAVVLGFSSFGRAKYFADDAAFSAQWAATNPDSSNAHNGLALMAEQSGDFVTALAEYRRSLQIDPTSATALNNTANVLIKLAQQRYAAGDKAGYAAALDEAAADYQKLLRFNPTDATALCNYGDLLGQRGDVNGAIASYRAAIAARPEYAQAHLHLGIALNFTGDPAGAIEEMKAALRLQPDWPPAQRALNQVEHGTH